jgi:glycosyltransferase involved in cell wall biosynthesis
MLGWQIGIGFNFYQHQDADVVVIQRPMHREIIERHIPALQESGKAVVVEIDDDFCALPAGNAAFFFTHPKRDPNLNALFLRRACAMADLVTCTTPALARRYAPHGRVAVIPNFVPAEYLQVPHTGDGKTVGWAGNIMYHPHDLDVCGIGVTQAVTSNDARFLAVGDEHTNAVLRIPENAGTHTGFVPLAEYPHQLARMDIGLVPLEDNQFNNGKSALKMLEYAACGVYPICTPSPDNMRLHTTYGIGTMASKPKHWQRAITTALQDSDARAAAVHTARTVVAQHLTYERNSQLWLDAWRQAQANRYHTQHTHVRMHTPTHPRTAQ